MTVTPAEPELALALTQLKAQYPHLGIGKVHARLLETHPNWLVSEKRTRRILQQEGLTLTSAPVIPGVDVGETEIIQHPRSKLIENLDVRQWTPKVRVKYFNKKKGKGLVATADIEAGETIWKEDPWVISPEWDIQDLIQASTACAHCTTPLNLDSPLLINCPSAPSQSSSTGCNSRFCNRLCSARSAKTHPLLCPCQNPAVTALLKLAKDSQWMALHALSQATARLLLSNQLGPAAWNTDWAVISGMAELSLEERYQSGVEGWSNNPEPDRAQWKRAHALYVQAFKEPKSSQDQKKLSRILKKPLPEGIDEEIFGYEGFLRNMGKMSLNLESHGGLYMLHAHLNHCCTPNVSIRHLDQRTALSRITAIAITHIKPGEELFITYVNPKLGVKERQQELKSWGFGSCACKRCIDEGKKLKEVAGNGTVDNDVDDLAKELKAGFGVF